MLHILPVESEGSTTSNEVNYLPNFPQGEDETSLETVRQENAVEVQKTEKNTSLIDKNMEKTFALR